LQVSIPSNTDFQISFLLNTAQNIPHKQHILIAPIFWTNQVTTKKRFIVTTVTGKVNSKTIFSIIPNITQNKAVNVTLPLLF
jgi:hypothetical protein